LLTVAISAALTALRGIDAVKPDTFPTDLYGVAIDNA
jgi:hypothetical protein